MRILSRISAVILLIVLFIVSEVPGHAAYDAGGRAAFTRGGWVGARYVGMGKAAEVTADDVFAIYWNPAGLSSLKARETMSPAQIREKVGKGEIKDITEKDLISFSEEGTTKNFFHVGISAGMLDVEREVGFLGTAFNLFKGVGGVGIYTIQSRDIESRDASGDFVKNMNYIASVGYLSYSWVQGIASLGVSLKVLQERIGENSYYGSGADFGVNIDVLPIITVGFVIQDVGSSIYRDKSESGVYDNLDFGFPSLKLGVMFSNRRDIVFAVTGVKKLEQEKYVLNGGLEYRLAKNMNVYLGISDQNFSSGISFQVFDIEFGYAFAFDNINMGYNNIISLSLMF